MRVAIWDGDDRAVREAPSLGKRFSADGSAERHTVVVTVRQPDEDGTASTNASVWDSRGAPAVDYKTGSLLFELGWRENAVDDPIVASGDVERLRSSLGLAVAS